MTTGWVLAVVLYACQLSAGLLLVTPVHSSGHGGHVSPNSPQDNALAAAQVELFVLRAAIPPSAPLKDGLVVIAPDTVPMTSERAAEVLAGMPKPVRCAGRVTEQDILSIECVQLSGRRESISHVTYVSIMEGALQSAHGAEPMAARRARVLLRSAARSGEEVHVSELAFIQWYQDYEIPPSITFSIWPQSEGVDPTFEVHRIESADPEGLPPEMRSFFR